MIFKPVNEGTSLAMDMRNLVSDNDSMLTFAAAVYKMYLERSGEKRMHDDGQERMSFGRRLPEGFRKSFDPVHPENGKFARAIDRLRHTYIHLYCTSRPVYNQMDTVEMLEFFIGKDVLPLTPIEYAELQLGVLQKFKLELEKMRNSICSKS